LTKGGIFFSRVLFGVGAAGENADNFYFPKNYWLLRRDNKDLRQGASSFHAPSPLSSPP
jgi:hypothetical protein